MNKIINVLVALGAIVWIGCVVVFVVALGKVML